MTTTQAWTRRSILQGGNWLQVLGTAERSQVAQRLGHHLHAIVPVLETFKAEPQPLERIFPGKGPLAPPPQGMEGGVDQPLAPALGALAVAGGLGAVGAPPRLEKALAIRSGGKAAVKRDLSASPVQPARFGQAFQGFQPLRAPHHSRCMHGRHGTGRPPIALVVGPGEALGSVLGLVARVAHASAPCWATGVVPSPGRPLGARRFSVARGRTLATNAGHSAPASAHGAKTL